MLTFNRWMLKSIFIILFFSLSMSHVLASVTKCRPTHGGSQIDMNLTFTITSNTATIPAGTTLDTSYSPLVSILCEFTDQKDNPVFFKNDTPDTIKDMLRNSGVDIYQQYTIGSNDVVNITAPVVPNLYLGYWDAMSAAIPLRYTFIAKKNSSPLKPFDTGLFLLGHHINELGEDLGMPVYARITSNLTLLCPTPKVDITASNGGGVNFGTISPQDMKSGGVVSKAFNLNMKVNPECETGLNISVRFEPNNNPVLDNKNLDMGNGLQVLLNNSTGDIDYDESYYVGELMPSMPVNLPYTATLSHIPGRDIVSGPFSKTIRVVVSY